MVVVTVFSAAVTDTLPSRRREDREREGKRAAKDRSGRVLGALIASSRLPEVMLLDVSARGESALHFCLDEGVALVPEALLRDSITRRMGSAF